MRACCSALAALLVASNAWAQQPPTPETNKTPIQIERVENRVVFSPDYKITRLDGHTGQLAGASAGYLIQEVLFIGGSAYWLASGATGWDLSYGGLVIGVRVPGNDRIAFGVKGLSGIGRATLNTTFGELIPGGGWPAVGLPMGGGGHWHVPFVPGGQQNAAGTRVQVTENFLVFEPQADLVFTVTKRIRFGVSGGYRATGGVDALGDRVNGATATVSVEFGLAK